METKYLFYKDGSLLSAIFDKNLVYVGGKGIVMHYSVINTDKIHPVAIFRLKSLKTC
jgi:hypothetical protein